MLKQQLNKSTNFNLHKPNNCEKINHNRWIQVPSLLIIVYKVTKCKNTGQISIKVPKMDLQIYKNYANKCLTKHPDNNLQKNCEKINKIPVC